MSHGVLPGPEFRWPVRIYWEDTDAGGIVFYANYLKFFERARTEWLRSLGISQHALREATGGMFVVSDTQVRYRRPARLDDELIVTASLHEMGRASMTITQKAMKTVTPPATSIRSRHTLSAAGPPQGAGAPSGGSVVREAFSKSGVATSVGAQLLCEGTIRIGWVDASTHKPARIPQTILETLK